MKENDFTLPTQRKEENFISFLESNFKVYQKFVKDEKILNQEELKDIKKIGREIILSLEEYYKGSPADAYKIFSKILDKYKDKFHTVTTKVFKKKPKRTLWGKSKPEVVPESLYRGRYSNEFLLKKEELFHIPFDKRFEKVKNQRYSINSFPCLYLSDSLFTCWNELGRHNFDNLQCSLFQLNEPKRFLNLGINNITGQILFIKDIHSNNEKEKMDFAIKSIYTWQIALACTVRVRDRKQKSYPEYIIPQLLLQWIKQTKDKTMIGIKYISTRIDSQENLYGKKYNYVIPVQEVNTKSSFYNGMEKYCSKLVDIFEMTEPVSWSKLNLIDTKFLTQFDAYILEVQNDISSLNRDYKTGCKEKDELILNTKREKYKITKFGVIEKYLQDQEVRKLQINNDV